MLVLGSVEQRVRAVERERVAIERAALARVSAVSESAVRHAAHAVRVGADPQAAARRVIVGDRSIGQAGMVPALTRALVMADLQGRRRTMLDYRALPKGLTLAQVDDEPCRCRKRKPDETLEEYRKRDKCGCWLLLFLGFDLAAMADFYETHRPYAERIAERTAQGLSNAIAEAVTPRQPPRSHAMRRHPRYQPSARRADETMPRPTIRRIAEEAGRQGLRASSPHRLRTEVAAAVVKSYDAGRMAGTPAATETLWGYHYSAILDDRTTDLCRSLDGTTLPKDDSFWKTFAPPNHFNCRSTVLPVWQSSALRTPDSFQPYASVEDIARFYEIKRRFLSYQ